MNFDYSDDEKALAEQARRLLAELSPLSSVRRLLDGAVSSEADSLWREVAALGWPAVSVSEDNGGIGFGHVGLCALAEEIGRAVAPLPMLPSIYLAADAIAVAGSAAQRAAWLPQLARGEVIGTALLDPVAPTVRYAAGKLNGTAVPVAHGSQAALAILSVATDDGDRLVLVDLADPAVTRTIVRTIDESRPHAALSFSDVPADLLGDGLASVNRLLARAAVPIAFEQLGGADACLAMTLAFVRERRSFARIVGSYQAVKHRLADMYVANELARSNAYFAAWALAADAPQLPLAAATARISATEAYEFAATETIQLHGGIGFTWESDCHLHYRRSRLLAQTVEPLAYWQDQLAFALDREGNA